MITVRITPENFAARCAELKEKEGIDITGNEGQVSKDGVTAQYQYDGVLFLVVKVLHKPFLDPMPLVESKLTAWLTGE